MNDRFKRLVRNIEVFLTPRENIIKFYDKSIPVVKSIWWDDSTQDIFDREILIYFKYLRNKIYGTIIDAGSANGYFSLACAILYPSSKIYAFEPSLRYRIIIRRNMHKNNTSGSIRIIPLGLWNKDTELPFRTHGAISSIKGIGSIPTEYDFKELIKVCTLDGYCERYDIMRVDLIKMDIEGSEIEALEGAKNILMNQSPELLIQAYHLRDNLRTYEGCASFLKAMGYTCYEADPPSGLLHAFK